MDATVAAQIDKASRWMDRRSVSSDRNRRTIGSAPVPRQATILHPAQIADKFRSEGFGAAAGLRAHLCAGVRANAAALPGRIREVAAGSAGKVREALPVPLVARRRDQD